MASLGEQMRTGAIRKIGSRLVAALLRLDLDTQTFVRDEKIAQKLQDALSDFVFPDPDQPGALGPAVEGTDLIDLLIRKVPTLSQRARNVLYAPQQVGNPNSARHSIWNSGKKRGITWTDQWSLDWKGGMDEISCYLLNVS